MNEPPASATASSSNPTPPPKKRRRLWLRILLALILILVLGIVLLPTLLSTGAGNRFILGMINDEIKGKVSADSLSLGWFSGATVKNLQISDPDGKLVLAVPAIDTGITVLSALRSAYHGDIHVHVASLDMLTGPDGVTNLSRALERRKPVPASPASKLDVLSLITVQVDALNWQGTSGPVVHVEIPNTSIKLETAGAAAPPADIQFKANVRSGDGPPARIEGHASLGLYVDGLLRDNFLAIPGSADFSIDSLNLASLGPMLQSMNLQLTPTGTLKGTLSAKNLGAPNATLKADFHVAQPIFAGAQLQGNTVSADEITIALSGGPVAGGTKQFQINATIALPHFVNTDAAKKPLLPPTNITITLNGVADMDANIFICGDGSQIEERDAQTKAGNVIQIAKGSKIPLEAGKTPYDIALVANYDLARIHQLLAGMLPEDLTMDGKRNTTLHLRGTLADDAGLRKFRTLELDTATIGWDRIASTSAGAELGKADVTLALEKGVLKIGSTPIPVTTVPGTPPGTLNLGGRVDLNQPTPPFIIDQPLALAQNVPINKQIASGPLEFLPLSWGLSKQQINLLHVGGTVSVQISSANVPLDSEKLATTASAKASLSLLHFTTDTPFFSSLTSALPLLKIGSLGQKNVGIPEQNVPNVAFELKDGHVHYDHFALQFGTVGLAFTGDVGLDKSLAVNLTVSEKALQVPIPVGISGTVSEPKLSMAKQSPEQTIQQALPGLLDKFAKPKK